MNSLSPQRLAALFSLAAATVLIWWLGWDENAAAWVRPWQDQGPGLWWGQAAYWSGLGGVQGGVLALAGLWGWLKHRRHLCHWSLYAVVSLALAGGLVQVVKLLVGRPRPRLHLPSWEYFGPTLQSDLHSFPSGHATTSFALAAVMGERWPGMAWLFYLVAALICVGRVISGSHHLSDVLGGAVLGLALGWPLARRFAVREGKLR